MANKEKPIIKPNWYKRWKAFPHHGQVHWLSLGLFAWVAGLIILGSYSGVQTEEKETAQGQVLGVRHSVVAPNINIKSEAEVKGEAIAPIILPSDLEEEEIVRTKNWSKTINISH